jgi:hypothetical protein
VNKLAAWTVILLAGVYTTASFFYTDRFEARTLQVRLQDRPVQDFVMVLLAIAIVGALAYWPVWRSGDVEVVE